LAIQLSQLENVDLTELASSATLRFRSDLIILSRIVEPMVGRTATVTSLANAPADKYRAEKLYDREEFRWNEEKQNHIYSATG
jgi:hypothetical protein